MSEEQAQSAEPGPESAHESKKGARDKVGDGIKQGIGVLSALKDAIEETINEARERGDLSAEKAREVMKDALGKAAQAGEKAKDRLDFASQVELDGLKDAMASVRSRLADLELQVFGASREPEEEPAGDGPEAAPSVEDQAADEAGD